METDNNSLYNIHAHKQHKWSLIEEMANVVDVLLYKFFPNGTTMGNFLHPIEKFFFAFTIRIFT